MKALTVRQPWAWAIFFGGKDVENRSWRTRFRGWIAIHAGSGLDPLSGLPRGVRRPGDEELVAGAILGVAYIVDVVEGMRSKWFHGPYGWKLSGTTPLSTPVACTGRLGLWTVAMDDERLVRRRLPSSVRERLDEIGEG